MRFINVQYYRVIWRLWTVYIEFMMVQRHKECAIINAGEISQGALSESV